MIFITSTDYFGPWLDHPDATHERKSAAVALIEKVNRCLADAEAHGVELEMNPHTATLISGVTYGGFRPQSCDQGAPHSSHKEGRGVDIYDRNGQLDRFLTDARLASYGLYRESPAATLGWTHLTDRSPSSGARTFQP